MFVKHVLPVLVLLIASISMSSTAPCWSQGSSVENSTDSSSAKSNNNKPSNNNPSNAGSSSSGPSNNGFSSGISDDDENQTMFYAFLKEDHDFVPGPMYDFLRNMPGVRELVVPHTNLERKFRPMLQWRHWADKHQRFFPALLFICLISALSWSCFPSVLQASAEECRTSFWKSFGTGVLVATIAMTTLRAVFLTEIGWPLGTLMVGASQAMMLIGLSVAIYILGHSIALLLQVKRITALASKPGIFRFTELFIGSFFAALLLQTPGIGGMSPCGTRLLALFAILGTGAMYRQLAKSRSNTTRIN